MKVSAIVIAGALLLPAGVYAQSVNDAQIASIVVTANQVDIDAGKLAAATSKNAEVKKFADLMVTDHTGVNQQAVALVTRATACLVTPEWSVTICVPNAVTWALLPFDSASLPASMSTWLAVTTMEAICASLGAWA